MDYILIEGLKVMASVGVHRWEKVLRQPLMIDLKLGCQLATPGHSDNLSDTLDYAQVAEFVRKRIHDSHFNLLETLATHIARDILDTYSKDTFCIQMVQISIKKIKIIPGIERVGVQVTLNNTHN